MSGSFHLAPLAGRGRILRAAKNPGEGGSPGGLLRGESPSPRLSPRKRGEGEGQMAARRRAQLLLVLLLILAAFLLVLLFAALFIVVAFIVVGHLAVVVFSQRLVNAGFVFGGLHRRALALAPVVFPGIEHQMQPWHHLLDRRQLAGRTGLAARTGFAANAGLALRACFAAFALRSRLARWAGLAARTIGSRFSRMALRPRSSLSADCDVRHLRPLR